MTGPAVVGRLVQRAADALVGLVFALDEWHSKR